MVEKKKGYFSEEAIQELKNEYTEVLHTSDEMLKKYARKIFTNKEADEFAKHGFGRRLSTLVRCVQNVYKICPPEQTKKLSREENSDLTINLQSFIFNTFGCLDNLAWVWVKESSVGKDLPHSKIGLLGKYKNGKNKGEYKFKEVRESFSPEFLEYLKSHDEWFELLEDFRHALAHRIPPYVPPFGLNKKEEKKQKELFKKHIEFINNNDFEKCKKNMDEIDNIGRFIPWLTHSYSEKSPNLVFHAQIIADLKTIIEISEKLFNEL